MDGFYFDQYALSALAQLLLTLGITLYLLSLRHKSSPTRWFLAFFAATTLYSAASLVEALGPERVRFYGIHLQLVTLCLAMVALLQFAYRFPDGAVNRASLRREARGALALSVAAWLYVSLQALWQFGQLRPGGTPTTRTPLADLWLLLACLWVAALFLRRTLALSRRHAPNDAAWRQLLRPRSTAARATGGFVWIWLLASLLALLSLGPWDLTRSATTQLSDWVTGPGTLLLFFLAALHFLNHTTERTSVVAKLVAIVALLFLLSFGVLGNVVAATYHASAEREPLPPGSLRFVPLIGQDGYRLTAQAAAMEPTWGSRHDPGALALPFPFTMYGRAYNSAGVTGDGVLYFGAWARRSYILDLVPAIVLDGPQATALWLRQEPDKLLVTWEYPEGFVAPNQGRVGEGTPTVVQLSLFPDNSFEIGWSGPLPLRSVHALGVRAGEGQGAVRSFDPWQATLATSLRGRALLFSGDGLHRQALDRWLRPLAGLLLLGTLLVILGLPLFLRRVLAGPLAALVAGVQAVDAGNLWVQVPRFAPDELGAVSESFNRMVASVRRSDARLEAQVAARTAALGASEARYRKLFDTMNSGVLVLTRDAGGLRFVVRALNRATEQLEGVSREALLGRAAHEVAPLADNATLAALVARAAHGHRHDSLPPVRYQTSGGWREVVAYNLSPDEIVLVFDDITTQVGMQAQGKQVAALEERERIGRALHDTMGQLLALVSSYAQGALAHYRADNLPQGRATLEQLLTSVQAAQREMHQTLLAIRAGQGEEGDFFDRLTRYLDSLGEHYQMEVLLSLPEALRHEVMLTPDVERHLLRVLQEALANVRKHARPRRARLLFTLHGAELQVVVSDDGPGFDPVRADVAGRAHVGLDIMRERATQVGGSVQVRSAPGDGTHVIVRVPRLPVVGGGQLVGTRVLLVDAHPIYREGLRSLLAAHGLLVVGTAQDGVEAQRQARALRPDLILMDAELPHRDGVEATRRIKQQRPEVTIVMLSVSAEPTTVRAALAAGAGGYLLKSQEGENFMALLAQALAGQTILSPTLADALLADRAGAMPPALPLTERQMEVLRLVVAGHSNREIAETLHVTESTVKYHVSNLLAELEVSSRHELAHLAQTRGWT